MRPGTFASWQGFVRHICIGWFERRWAWYPVDRLQLELSATTGQHMQPSAIAEYMGIVYATLERVTPQFPSR